MRKIVICLSLALLCAAIVNDAAAAGLGVYGSVGGGRADWSPENTANFKKTTGHLDFGLAMDTAPARDKLYNYNLTVGYGIFRNMNNTAWGTADLDGLIISNSFGFGTLVTPKIRIWFGPEIKVTWVDGSPQHYSNYKINLFGVGKGLVLGVNFNDNEKLTTVVKMGFQVFDYVGEGKGFFSHETNSASTSYLRRDYDVREKMLTLTLEFLFRTSDDR